MSHYDWEAGTLTLPSKEVVPFKKLIRDAANRQHELFRIELAKLYSDVTAKTRSPKKVLELLDDMSRKEWTANNDMADARRAALSFLIEQATGAAAKHCTMHHPTGTEITPRVPRYTNRDTKFAVLSTDLYTCGSIEFSGNTVQWRTEENNHAVDRAEDSLLGRTFFANLQKIAWTRGTGGKIIGNDEYNSDSENEGGGGNYTRHAYGPLGGRGVGRIAGTYPNSSFLNQSRPYSFSR